MERSWGWWCRWAAVPNFYSWSRVCQWRLWRSISWRCRHGVKVGTLPPGVRYLVVFVTKPSTWNALRAHQKYKQLSQWRHSHYSFFSFFFFAKATEIIFPCCCFSVSVKCSSSRLGESNDRRCSVQQDLSRLFQAQGDFFKSFKEALRMKRISSLRPHN